ncbi:hypothetical protein HYDPIDRAFT_33415 [Hydnomerulius pinastri MD-312]|uniref:Uncharacterized protein n=1 Tax=Hydnomerulius pinastri MD-312 TaxID=994086 RepID=A0A0C9VNI2_9AGAM|nr:hypothetical protein HYDPIDRAFT_33415 [Hydnomerulius pinastri MD-312]
MTASFRNGTTASEARDVLPSRTDPTQGATVPPGWTDKIGSEGTVKTIKTMLIDSTELNVDKVLLTDDSGTRYIFEADSKHYMWNMSRQDGAYIKSPQGREAIFAQLAEDPTKLEVELLDDE